MSTKFFNNEAGNTLFDILKGIASGMATFDRFLAVVGFFRSLAGFKKKVISIVDKILDSGYSVDLNKLLNETIYSSYDLSSAEIQIIEQSI